MDMPILNKTKIIFLTGLVGLVGCSTNWSHSSAGQAQFRQDMAQCEMFAQATVPDTSAPPNPYLSPSQQAAQSASNAGAQLGRAFSLRNQFNNCMLSKGYSK